MEHNTAIRLHEVFGTPVFILLSQDTFQSTCTRFPGQGGMTVLGSCRDDISTKAKNISLQSPGERKNYLGKSWVLVNVLSFLHAGSELLQHSSAAREGTGQAGKLPPTLRKHARSDTSPKKSCKCISKNLLQLKGEKDIKTEQSALILTRREYNLTKYQIKASQKKGVTVVQ